MGGGSSGATAPGQEEAPCFPEHQGARPRDGASRGSEVPGEARQEGWMTRSTEAKVRGSDSTPSGRKKPLGVFSRRNDII